MLKSIVMVTMLVTNLNITEEAYNNHLNYEVVDRGVIDDQLSTIWDADGMLDHPYLVMQPSSNQEVYLRFIECEDTTNYKPVGTHGWNSTEILVQGPDQLALDLKNSEFDIIGMP